MSVLEPAAIQRIAVKMMCASDLLQNISTQLTKDLEASERKVSRYICQAKLLLSWKRGNAAIRIVGTTVKTVGIVAVMASSLSPRYRTAVTVGEKMWKLGTGLKILSYVANIIKETWQKGCRESFLDFMRHTSTLVRNVGVLDELVVDVRQTIDSMRDSHGMGMGSAEEIWNVVSSFIPNNQRVYIRHIINLVLSSPNYSPLFDFAALITDPSSDSDVVQLMREIESIQFLKFIQENDTKTLVAIGSFLHVTRELVEFLDNLASLRENDCVFLQQCLERFAEESKKIKPVVLFLKDLNTIRSEFQSTNLTVRESDVPQNNLTITTQESCGESKNSVSDDNSGMPTAYYGDGNEEENLFNNTNAICEDNNVTKRIMLSCEHVKINN